MSYVKNCGVSGYCYLPSEKTEIFSGGQLNKAIPLDSVNNDDDWIGVSGFSVSVYLTPKT